MPGGQRIFDIESPAELFAMLQNRFNEYRADGEKSTEDAISIVLLTNHLREWIAPGYKRKGKIWPPARNTAEEFSRQIYEHSDFKIIRDVANGTKHLRCNRNTDTMYFGDATQEVLVIGKIAGKQVLKGIPCAHFIDDRLFEDVLDPIIKLYDSWFSRSEVS